MGDVSCETCFVFIKNELQKHRMVHQSNTFIIKINSGAHSVPKFNFVIAIYYLVSVRLAETFLTHPWSEDRKVWNFRTISYAGFDDR